MKNICELVSCASHCQEHRSLFARILGRQGAHWPPSPERKAWTLPSSCTLSEEYKGSSHRAVNIRARTNTRSGRPPGGGAQAARAHGVSLHSSLLLWRRGSWKLGKSRKSFFCQRVTFRQQSSCAVFLTKADRDHHCQSQSWEGWKA